MQCNHLGQIREVKPNSSGCEECLKTGGKWVELRVCLTCGHVGCCDSSFGKHARKHFNETKHSIIRPLEKSQDWKWCYVDNAYL